MLKQTLIALAMTTAFTTPALAAPSAPPKLVLQITVDALRADLPERFLSNMGEGGFRYLLEQGVHYSNAHYQHANTETIVGHVALATGAPPAVNGMVGNVWFDRQQGRAIYNIEDSHFSELTSGQATLASVELDDTQNTAQGSGRSPLNIMASTFSDEIVKANNGGSRAYAVSFKDRGAVSLAGELGKAFWFSKASGGFVTSEYYYDAYPSWVTQWNNKDYIRQYSNQSWDLLLPRDKYLFAEEGNTDFKVKLASFKRNFPYPYGPADYPYFTTMLSLSPAADDIVNDFSKALISAEQLGQGKYTDYLAVSFSANDYVIHANGPSSIEAEDNLLRLDRTLADLFNHIDSQVGLDNTLIVLSADHGAPDSPSYISNHGRTQSAYFNAAKLKQQGLFDQLEAHFGIGEAAFVSFENPNLYLNRDLIQQKGINLAEIQSFIAEQLVKIEGIDQVFTSTAIENGALPNSRIAQLVANNYYPSRSGDLYLVFNPGVYINAFDSLSVASVHGSPWRYDTHVPIIFAGYQLKPQKLSREVSPYDIAPTLSSLLNIGFPSGATGQVLTEVVN